MARPTDLVDIGDRLTAMAATIQAIAGDIQDLKTRLREMELNWARLETTVALKLADLEEGQKRMGAKLDLLNSGDR